MDYQGLLLNEEFFGTTSKFAKYPLNLHICDLLLNETILQSIAGKSAFLNNCMFFDASGFLKRKYSLRLRQNNER